MRATEHPLYSTWVGMRARCRNPKTDGYHRYGGRGIKVWGPWDSDFWAFAFYMGEKPTPQHSVDRMEVDGDYEPGNVRWATPKEQQAHRVKKSKTKPKKVKTKVMASDALAESSNPDERALALVFSKVTKAEIAKHLGIAKQNLTRWKKVPPHYVGPLSELTGLPREYILPSVFA